jgi:hypothetical protein
MKFSLSESAGSRGLRKIAFELTAKYDQRHLCILADLKIDTPGNDAWLATFSPWETFSTLLLIKLQDFWVHEELGFFFALALPLEV